ncbi:THUMP-like domain-containing protein [Nafulsella turpanensis]|uniref:THUMP-like domain-containing protein n=1 Tax=Nafulsella turpanensis TaxID=1265690 RepID=UPI00034B3009|nr:class I SAM-dependent methyltransferase [Nafulsella turpanensis]
MIPEALLQPQVRQWIQEHENEEPAQLMLQAHRFPAIPVREAVAQIQARQKVKHKLPAWYANEKILYPPTLSVEQASSEETGLYKAALLQGKTIADLTGGMGVDTWYLSRHFEKAFYVEQQENLCAFAIHNFKAMDVTHVHVVHDEAENFLRQAPALDATYLDPARRGEGNQKLYKLADCQPDVTQLLPLLFQKASTILLKAAPMLDIQQGLSELCAVKEVHVVAVKNEVKELLFLMEKGFIDPPLLKTVNLSPEGEQSFQFYITEEQQAQAFFSEPQAYLYEPHAALMKAGAFKLVGERYRLKKLHPNSHLYTSLVLAENFPGRSFKILFAGKTDKKVLRQFFPAGKALISSRNHPMSVQQLTKKLGLKEGGDRYLFATTFASGKPGIIIAERVG